MSYSRNLFIICCFSAVILLGLTIFVILHHTIPIPTPCPCGYVTTVSPHHNIQHFNDNEYILKNLILEIIEINFECRMTLEIQGLFINNTPHTISCLNFNFYEPVKLEHYIAEKWFVVKQEGMGFTSPALGRLNIPPYFVIAREWSHRFFVPTEERRLSLACGYYRIRMDVEITHKYSYYWDIAMDAGLPVWYLKSPVVNPGSFYYGVYKVVSKPFHLCFCATC